MMEIEIGTGLACDLERLIETKLLVQANSGGGKSWLLRRLLEQTHGHVQQIVIDPEGEFGTLRSKFDYVHAAKSGADTAAVPRAAALLAERLLELKVSAILDIYELKPLERKLFVNLFLEAMVNAPKTLWHRALVLVDETHVFCEQTEKKLNQQDNAVIDMATRGRKRGFGLVMATQRLSKLHKDAAAEGNNKLIGRTTLDVDVKRAANELGMAEKDARLLLRVLKPGEFFAYGPAFIGETNEYGIMRTKIGGTQTQHPKFGGSKYVTPPPTSKIRAMLPSLADLPAEAEEREKSVQALSAENNTLKREIEALKRTGTTTQVEVERIVEVIPKHVMDELAVLRDAVGIAASDLEERVMEVVKSQGFGAIHRGAEELLHTAEQVNAKVASKPRPPIPTPAPTRTPVVGGHPGHSMRPKPPAVAGDQTVDRAARAVLTVLLQREDMGEQTVPFTRIALWSGYQKTASTIPNAVSKLRKLGYITGMLSESGGVSATPEGREYIASTGGYERLPQGRELRDYWLGKLGDTASAKILRAVLEVYPRGLTRAEIAERTNYSPTASTIPNGLSELRGYDLIDAPRNVDMVTAKAELF